jgi:hypothetical protein
MRTVMHLAGVVAMFALPLLAPQDALGNGKGKGKGVDKGPPMQKARGKPGKGGGGGLAGGLHFGGACAHHRGNADLVRMLHARGLKGKEFAEAMKQLRGKGGKGGKGGHHAAVQIGCRGGQAPKAGGGHVAGPKDGGKAVNPKEGKGNQPKDCGKGNIPKDGGKAVNPKEGKGNQPKDCGKANDAKARQDAPEGGALNRGLRDALRVGGQIGCRGGNMPAKR